MSAWRMPANERLPTNYQTRLAHGSDAAPQLHSRKPKDDPRPPPSGRPIMRSAYLQLGRVSGNRIMPLGDRTVSRTPLNCVWTNVPQNDLLTPAARLPHYLLS